MESVCVPHHAHELYKLFMAVATWIFHNLHPKIRPRSHGLRQNWSQWCRTRRKSHSSDWPVHRLSIIEPTSLFFQNGGVVVIFWSPWSYVQPGNNGWSIAPRCPCLVEDWTNIGRPVTWQTIVGGVSPSLMMLAIVATANLKRSMHMRKHNTNVQTCKVWNMYGCMSACLSNCVSVCLLVFFCVNTSVCVCVDHLKKCKTCSCSCRGTVRHTACVGKPSAMKLCLGRNIVALFGSSFVFSSCCFHSWNRN